jgi:hypothetical protein
MTASSLVILFLGIVVGLVVVFFISATLYRLAVKIVAQFTPGYANILFAFILQVIATGAVAIGLQMAGIVTASTIGAILLKWLAFYVLGILVLGVMIKNRNGQSLGLFNAFLADIVTRLIIIAISFIFIAALIGVYGHQPISNAMNLYVQQAEAGYAKGQAILAARANAAATPPPSTVSSVDQLLQQPLPGAAHYYLKTPLTETVAYGQMTYPANTEVRLISQSGNTCEIEVANNTFTVSRSQVTTALQ